MSGLRGEGKSFGELHFGGADLGDERRERRLPQLVDAVVRHPGGTLPEKLPRAADRDAFHRLCEAEEVTHAAVLAPHRAKVLQKLHDTSKFLLAVHDATEFDYTTRTSLRELGQIGKGTRRGYVVQHALVVDPDAGTALGLANQILHRRVEVPPDEPRAAARERESRESRLWQRSTEGFPGRREVVDVCDRGADTFEHLEHEVRSGRTFVIRAAHDRCLPEAVPEGAAPDAPPRSLFEVARAAESRAESTATMRVDPPGPDAPREGRKIRRRKSRTAPKADPPPTFRIARLLLAAVPVLVRPPQRPRGEHGDEPLPMWVVRIWEPQPPAGCEPLEWILLTNHPCDDPAELLRVQQWYEWRWIVEEYHKAQKTGVRIEALQFRDEDRLEPALAVLSVVALLLLQIRDAARRPDAHHRRADELVDPEAIQVLAVWLHRQPRPDWSLRDFYVALARLGGYVPRKDSHPGWLTLWRGHTKLELMLEGARTRPLPPAPQKCAQS